MRYVKLPIEPRTFALIPMRGVGNHGHYPLSVIYDFIILAVWYIVCIYRMSSGFPFFKGFENPESALLCQNVLPQVL